MAELVPVFILIWVFTVVSGVRKAKMKKTANRPVAAATGKQADMARKKTSAKSAVKADLLEGTAEGEDPCHDHFMRPREIRSQFVQTAPERMEAAMEGEDPCHPAPILAQALGESEEERTPLDGVLGEDLVRAVIWSEILAKPRGMRR